MCYNLLYQKMEVDMNKKIVKKKTIENIAKNLPFALKNATGYFKDNFEKSGQDMLTNSTGTVSVLVRFFAQDAIDAYFKKLTKQKLEDFAFLKEYRII